MKIGWILVGDSTVPSTRIMALNVIEYMHDHGMANNIILRMPNTYDPWVADMPCPEVDYCVFQKVCLADSLTVLRKMKAAGIRTIYIIDDLFQEAIHMCREADIVISGSYFLSEAIKKATGRDSIVIPDAYETPKSLCKKSYNSDKIRVIWYGTVGHFPQALELEPIVKGLGYEYFTVTGHPAASRQWSLKTIWNDILDSEIVVIPYLGKLPDYEKAKGNNRLTQAMVLGLPVIASPIPSYTSIVDQFRTGILVYDNTEESWRDYLEYLGDSKVRETMGKAAREQVKEVFNIANVVKIWMEMLYEDQTRNKR